MDFWGKVPSIWNTFGSDSTSFSALIIIIDNEIYCLPTDLNTYDKEYASIFNFQLEFKLEFRDFRECRYRL